MILSGPCAIPVSYTHLDVYKRQVESFSETAKLYNWAYNNFSMRQVAATDELYRQPVALSKHCLLYTSRCV